MAAGWHKFTGQSQYPELTSNKEKSAFTYGSKANRNFRMGWIQGARNDKMENDMLNWIASVTGVQFSTDREEVIEHLHDGKVLCQFLVNLNGDCLVRPINIRPALFSATENITNFQETLQRLGLRQDQLFAPSELLEKKDITGLVLTLKKLQELRY